MNDKTILSYLDEKVDPVFGPLMKRLVEERPEDPATFCVEYLKATKRPANPASNPRPEGAVGTFLRIVTVNDVYKLENYAHLATAVAETRKWAAGLDCVVSSHLNGDFLSPCVLTALDGGRAMVDGLNLSEVDLVCLGNHELDLGFESLGARLAELKATVVNSNVAHPALDEARFPPYATLRVGARLAVVGGFLTEDPSIYPPSLQPDIQPVRGALRRTWDRATRELRARGALGPAEEPDLFLPMTHQLMKDDRATGARLASGDPALARKTPVLLAGHDHSPFIETCGESLVVKVGQDCEAIGFVDVWWDARGALHCAHSLAPCTDFAAEPRALAFAQEKERYLKGMMDVGIARLPDGGSGSPPLSTKRVRFEESAVASFLLSLVKRGCRRDGVEVACVQAGAVRAGRDYAPGAPFTLGDLYDEFAFDCKQCVVTVPGHVLAASVANTRAMAKPAPNFLHLDADCTVEVAEGSGAHVLTRLNGRPVVPGKLYRVVIYQFLLTGLNVIEPLLSYVTKESGQAVPDEEACEPVKHIVLSQCMQEAWRAAVHFASWGHAGAARPYADLTGEPPSPSGPQVDAGVDAALAMLDGNGDGFVCASDLLGALERQGLDPTGATDAPSAELAGQMIKALDSDGDGRVSRADLATLAL